MFRPNRLLLDFYFSLFKIEKLTKTKSLLFFILDSEVRKNILLCSSLLCLISPEWIVVLNPCKSRQIVIYNARSKPLASSAVSIGTVSVEGKSSMKLQTSCWKSGWFTSTQQCSLTSKCLKNRRLVFPHSFVVWYLGFSYYWLMRLLKNNCSNCWLPDLIPATLSWLALPFQIWIAFSWSWKLLLEWSPTNLCSVASHLFFLICIGFRFTTKLCSKIAVVWLYFMVLNFQQPSCLASLSHIMYQREHSAPLHRCQ